MTIHIPKRIPGRLFVLAAPSGAGKTSLAKELTASDENLHLSISHTTRPQRPGEEDGRDYFFLDQAKFDEMAEQGEFLEHANVFGNHYGTSLAWVKEHLDAGYDVLLEIDWQGARQIREAMPESISIFVLPPNSEALQERLTKRKQDEAEVIESRLAAATAEMSHYDEFDYLVVNTIFDHALAEIRAIVQAERLKRPLQIKRYEELLAELLKNR